MELAKLTLGYWNVRGRGGVLRNLLHYCEVPYEHKVYQERDEWFAKDKEGLGFDFPNLPYIIDGETKITETIALIQYIPEKGNKKELLGDTAEKKAKVLEALSVGSDLRAAVRNICFTKGDFRKEIDDTFANGQAKSLLTRFEKILESREWIIGSLSVADFWLCEHLDMICSIDESKLEPYTNLTKFQKRFHEIPKIAEFRNSEKHFKLWFFPGANPTVNPTGK